MLHLLRTREHTCGTKGRICFEQDPEVAAVLSEFMLGKERVQLDLVYTWNDSPCLTKLIQVGNRPVGYADSLDLTGLVDLFHLAPGLTHVPRSIDRPGAVRIDRKKLTRLILSTPLATISKYFDRWGVLHLLELIGRASE